MKQRFLSLKRDWIHLSIFLALSLISAVVSRYHYLLFHTLIEIFTVLVTFSAVTIIWDARRFLRDGFFLYLGIGLFTAAVLDLIHSFAYRGMPFFPGYDSNLPTQLWIAARLIQAAAFVGAPFFLKRKLRLDRALTGYGLTLVLMVGLIFSGLFPDCYVEGQGLTPFKIGAEFVVIVVLVIAAFFLARRRNFLDESISRRLVVALGAAIISEVCFTLYTDVYGISNMLGHLFKALSFWMIYLAVVRTGVRAPQELLMSSLQHSEARYRLLAENISDVLWLVDEKVKTFKYISPSVERLLGYTPAEVMSLPLTEIMSPASVEMVLQVIRDQLEVEPHNQGPDKPELVEVECIRKDGTLVWVETTTIPVRDEEGKFNGLLGLMRNIEERRRAQEEIQRREKELRTLVSNLPDVISRFDRDLRHVYVSPVVEAFSGIKPEQFIGKTNQELQRMPSSLTRKWDAAIRQVFESRASNQIEFIIPGEYESRYCETLLVPEFDGAGEVETVLWINRDVTSRKRAEQELLQAQKLAGLGTLAAGAAHEINSPLQAITSTSEMLLRAISRGECDQMQFTTSLERIKQSAWRVAEIVRSMLVYARPTGPDDRPTSVNQVIHDELLADHSKLAEREGLKVLLDLDPDLPYCAIDCKNLAMVVTNLLSNAADALGPDGGEIRIGTVYDAEREAVRLMVSDNGVGMDEVTRQRIFDPFFTTKPVGSGVGMGLSITHAIVTLHGGEIEVESQEERGSTFRVYLPAALPLNSNHRPAP